MPREAKRELVGSSVVNGINMVAYKCPFEDADTQKEVTVTVPADASAWQTLVLGLTGENLDTAYSRWLGAVITAAKAELREAVAAESTVVKRDGKDVDVLAMRNVVELGNAERNMSDAANVKLACAVINAAYMQANAFGWDGIKSGKGTSAPQNAFIVARRKLVDAKKGTLKGEGTEFQKMVIPA